MSASLRLPTVILLFVCWLVEIFKEVIVKRNRHCGFDFLSALEISKTADVAFNSQQFSTDALMHPRGYFGMSYDNSSYY